MITEEYFVIKRAYCKSCRASEVLGKPFTGKFIESFDCADCKGTGIVESRIALEDAMANLLKRNKLSVERWMLGAL